METGLDDPLKRGALGEHVTAPKSGTTSTESDPKKGAGTEKPGEGTVAATLQGEREGEVVAKLEETDQVDPFSVREHGLLCKLRNGHSLGVFATDFADDGRHVASCSFDASVNVWDVDTQRVRRKYRGHTAAVTSVRFIPTEGNERLATASEDGTVRVWDKRSAKTLFTFQGQFATAARCVRWFPSGKHIVACSDDANIIVWDAEAAVLTADDPTQTMDDITVARLFEAPYTPEGHRGSVRALEVAIDGRTMYTGGADGCIRQWRVDLLGGRIALRRKIDDAKGEIMQVTCNPDGSLFASACSDSAVRVYSSRTGACLHTLTEHAG